jgi:UDP-glucose 4-epimerase
MKGKKVLVTGAGGFIGSHLVERLVHEGARVTAFVRYNSRGDHGLLSYVTRSVLADVDVAAGDIRDGPFLEGLCAGKDVVFHLAALIGIPYSYVAPESYVAANVEGTLNLLRAARRNNVGRIVHTSTSETYGTATYVPIDESHPLRAQSPYAASKIGADKLAESFFLSFGLPIVTIRPFNTFGPRQSQRAVIPTIISQALRSQEVSLGSVSPVRDLNYVSDTVEGFLLCATTPGIEGEVFNVGRGEGLSVADCVSHAGAVLGRQLRVCTDASRVRPSTSEVMRLVADISKAARLLGYKPRVLFQEGLARTAEFIEAHPELYPGFGYVV